MRLISTIAAPWWRAYAGSIAAGYTSAAVPTTRSMSQSRAACSARASASSGSVSSNHTTSGRRKAPHCAHPGASRGLESSHVATIVPSREHLTRWILPWSSTTFVLPAA
jgi:hypothetical protein